MPGRQFDVELVAIAIILCSIALIALISILRNPLGLEKGRPTFRHLALSGAGVVVFSLIGSALVANDYSVRHAIDTLLIRKVSDWMFRAVLPFAYSALIVGIGGLIMSHCGKRSA